MPSFYDADDTIIWSPNELKGFSIQTAWQSIRTKGQRQRWNKLIWQAPLIPRYCFVTWLASKGRLDTQDRIKKWGISFPNRCVLCKNQEEMLDHCFMDCNFSTHLWTEAMALNGISVHGSATTIQWLSQTYDIFKGKSLEAKRGRLRVNSTIYHIW